MYLTALVTMQMQLVKTKSNELVNADVLLWT